jgi:hypothetical protein
MNIEKEHQDQDQNFYHPLKTHRKVLAEPVCILEAWINADLDD